MKEINGKIHSDNGFYIGDICDALNEQYYHDFWGNKNGYKDGVFVNDLGIGFAVAGTANGDGVYKDQFERHYAVDAGIIGIVSAEIIDNDCNAGIIEKCSGDADFSAANGIFSVKLPNGKEIKIDTRI